MSYGDIYIKRKREKKKTSIKTIADVVKAYGKRLDRIEKAVCQCPVDGMSVNCKIHVWW